MVALGTLLMARAIAKVTHEAFAWSGRITSIARLRFVDRLSGTRVKTNIVTNGVRVREGFGLIHNWKIIPAHPRQWWMEAVEVTLNQWPLTTSSTRPRVLDYDRRLFSPDDGGP